MEHNFVFQLLIFAYSISSIHYTEARAVIEFEVISLDNNAMVVVKTGVREFTLFRYDNNYNYAIPYSYGGFTVMCSTIVRDSMNPSLTMYKNDVKVTGGSTAIRGHYFVGLRKYYHLSGSRQDKIDTYSCQFSASALNVNQSRLVYGTRSEIEIKSTSSTYIYSSSVGETGYTNESVLVFCDGYRLYESEGHKRTIYLHHRDVSHRDLQPNEMCSWYDYYKETPLNISIDHPISGVAPSLALHLTPTSFEINSTLNFACTSYPPRMMYWTIIGKSGNLLDISDINPTFMTDTNVTVKQEVGETTMNISEGYPGGNDIERVTCSTYDTDAHVVASSHLLSPEEENDANLCDVTTADTTTATVTPSAAADTTTATVTPSAATEETTIVTTDMSMEPLSSARANLQTTRLKTEPTCDCERNSNRMHNSRAILTTTMTKVGLGSSINRLRISDYEEVDLVVPLLLTTALLVLVIFFLLGVIFYSYVRYKGDPPVTSKCEVMDDGIPMGTVMHDNPAYTESLSEASDDPDDDQCSYVNV